MDLSGKQFRGARYYYAECLLKVGDRKTAAGIFRETIEQWPDTSFARKAERYLSDMQDQ